MSGLVPICLFIDLYDPETNGIQERFQNGDPVNAISFTSPIPEFGTGAYKYLSFLYSGATQTKSGDNLEASLVLANTSTLRDGSSTTNKLSMNYAQDAVNNGWCVYVHVCKMNTTFTTVEDVISTDCWNVTSMGYDATNIEVMLSTGVDAVGGNIGRFLTSSLVGHLPITGNIRTK